MPDRERKLIFGQNYVIEIEGREPDAIQGLLLQENPSAHEVVRGYLVRRGLVPNDNTPISSIEVKTNVVLVKV